MPSGRSTPNLVNLDDIRKAGGKTPVALGGTGTSAPAGSALNLSLSPLRAVRGPSRGNVRIDPAGRVTVHRGLNAGIGTGPTTVNPDGLSHNAFPVLETTATGRMICAYRRGTGHAEPNNAAGSSWVCKFSDDMGATWTPNPTVIWYDPSGDTKDCCLRRLRLGRKAGRIISLVCSTRPATAERSLVTYSDDHGATWSTPVSIYDSARWGVNGRQKATTVMEMPNGTLLAGCYGQPTPQVNSRYQTTVYASTDSGATWTYRGTIDDGSYLDRQPEEPVFALGQDGYVYAAVRYDGDSTVRVYRSADAGATWTAPNAPIGSVPGKGRAGFLQMSTGAWVCVTRHPTTNNPVLYVSRDNCVTWTVGSTIDELTAPQYTYSDLYEVGPGVAALAYGMEYPITGAYSSVYLTYLLDGAGRSPLGGTLPVSYGVAAPSPPMWTQPPAKSVDTSGANLKATLDSLIDYLVAVNVVIPSPKSLASCFAWHEPRFIQATVNDLVGNFTADDSSNTVPVLSRNDGRTLSGTAASGTWGVASNQLYCSSGAGLYQWDTSKANYTLQADVTYTANAASIALRYVDSSNFLEVQYGGFPMRVRKTVAGVATTLASSATYSPTSGVQSTIKVVLSGATVSVYAVDAGGTLPTNPTITYTLSGGEQSTFLTPTRAGFLASANTSRYDNLSVTYGLSDGDTIGLLTDQTAAGTNLTQTTVANMPTYARLTGYFRGLPALLHNGFHYLVSSVFAAKSRPNGIVVAVYFPGAPSNFQKIAGAGPSSGQQTLSFSSAAKLQMNAGTGVAAATAPAFPFGVHVLEVLFDGANSRLMVDGVQLVAGDAGTGTWTQAIIGDQSNGVQFYYLGSAFFNGPTTASDMALARRYFAQLLGVNVGV